ncbi:N-acetylmuramoyl-L-alanine amidase [Haloimpatiens sp. FM7330]|uniref:N-acetylmuramoyl-L-alanine amidase family protein n=1 Tax=Haloimpatiens sp. FM7330 TaxID=3298610 RepID=UPI00364430CC
MKVKKSKIFVRVLIFMICIFIFKLIIMKITYKKNGLLQIEQSNTYAEEQVNNKKSINNNINSKFTVVIDPGHGGYDEGTKSLSGILEKDVTLKVALEVGKILKKNNINVIYTRTSDRVSWPANEKEDLRERVKISNEVRADLFVSIHCNGSENRSYYGIESWCRFPNTEGEKLAKSIQKQLLNLNYSVDRGLKYEADGSLAVLKLNKAVSVLIELGFLTNSSDEQYITSESGQAECAEAIADGILKYKLGSKE